MTDDTPSSAPFYVLSLDGGGAKGIYTLGILQEIEGLLGSPISDHFQLIYGTSTGAIIAASLGLGMRVGDIIEQYNKGIPKIMGTFRSGRRSRLLRHHLETVFADRKFDAFKTRVGLVAANTTNERPMIFKTGVDLAHGLKDTFAAGFGQTIALAVEASCSAYPFFNPVCATITSPNMGFVTLVDGGFVAANPSFFALTDALHAREELASRVRFLSLGVGRYRNRTAPVAIPAGLRYAFSSEMITRQFSFNANTSEKLFEIHSKRLGAVLRVDDESAAIATSLLESRPEVLNKLMMLGRASYERHEKGIRGLLQRQLSSRRLDNAEVILRVLRLI